MRWKGEESREWPVVKKNINGVRGCELFPVGKHSKPRLGYSSTIPFDISFPAQHPSSALGATPQVLNSRLNSKYLPLFYTR